MSIDKRKYPRLNAQVEVVVKNISHDAVNFKEDTKLLTRDVAVAGICIVTRKPLKISDVVEMDIKLPSGQNAHAVGVVCWIAEQGSVKGLGLSDFYVGVKFTQITNSDRSLIGQFVFDNMK